MAVTQVQFSSQDLVKIDSGNDNKINGAELNDLAAYLGVDAAELTKLLEGAELSGGNLELRELLEKMDVERAPTDKAGAETLLNKAQSLEKAIEKTAGKIATLEGEIAAGKAKTPPVDVTAKEEQLGALKEAKEKMIAEMKDALASLKAGKDSLNASQTGSYKGLAEKYFHGLLDSPSSPAAGSSGPAVDWAGMAKAQMAAGAQQKGGLGELGAKAMGIPGAGGGAGGSLFNPTAFAFTTMVDDFKLQSWDMAGEAQKKQHLMMLFLYYARMAMSGDMNAMYQFMRFISYVISTDKALQNVWMGTKLIQLQEESRKATQKLLNADVGDDNASQTSFLKLQQEVRAEENTIATSQKLIAQMMEEFTQVTELLTNVQKSLLDANGKILSNISVWR